MSLTSLNRLRSISIRITPRSTPSRAIRPDSILVSAERFANPVSPSVREAAVLRYIVRLMWFSDTMTTAMHGSAHGPRMASAATSGAAIRLTPQIRTLLPKRSYSPRHVAMSSSVSARPIRPV